jgi:hypothetical protein
MGQKPQGQSKGNGENSNIFVSSKCRCGCVIKVSDGPKGASKRIYLGCLSETEATETQISILQSASYALRHSKTTTIGKTRIADHVIVSMVCAQIFFQNLTMTSVSRCVHIYVCMYLCHIPTQLIFPFG